jgi:hypothetical protein
MKYWHGSRGLREECLDHLLIDSERHADATTIHPWIEAQGARVS